MDMYGSDSRSIPQKIIILLLEVGLLWLAYWILFQGGDATVMALMGLDLTGGLAERRMIIFGFSVFVFLRIGFTLLYLMKRKMPWEEVIGIPLAFATYYVGYALLVVNSDQAIDWIDYIAIAIFLLGSYLNTGSKLQRHFWKKKPENKGKLYTIGLFKYSMHINFFGDLLWVSAYAIITRNWYAIIIPIFIFCFFAFANIPKLDAYLAEKYSDDFEDYSKNTKKFIPFIY